MLNNKGGFVVKETYERAEMEVVLFDSEEIITTSTCPYEGPQDDDF